MYSYDDYLCIHEALRKKEKEDLSPYKDINLDDGYIVTPTFHIKDERDGTSVSRDISLDEPSIKRILNKALKNGLKDQPSKSQGHLIMKNKVGKWDDFIIVKDAKHLTLKSILLQDRNNPNYFTKEGDFKLIIENSTLFQFTIAENLSSF